MNKVDELFSKYGSSGSVEVEGFDLKKIRTRKRKGPKLEQSLTKSELKSDVKGVERKPIVESKVHMTAEHSEREELKLAFSFQSEGWQGTLMDRLNTFSYKDLFKKRIAKVREKTADITNRLDKIKNISADL